MRLRGGFEITVQLPKKAAKQPDTDEFAEQRDTDETPQPPHTASDLRKDADREPPTRTFIATAQRAGFTVSDNWIRSPEGALFGVTIDHDALEVSTPPLASEESARILAPLFDVSTRLGWTHTTGGGHMHLDLEAFRQEPRRFVNFLIAIENNPLVTRLFLPVEGEPTLYQQGKQKAFGQAVHDFGRLDAPTWEDVVRLFKPLYENKFTALRWHDDTLEVRCLGNQKYPEAATRELDFFEAIWRSAPSDKLDEVVSWNDESFYRNLDPERVAEEAGYLFAQFGLPEAPYHNWVNDYGKTRRRAYERALEEGNPEAIQYGISEADMRRLLTHAGTHGFLERLREADPHWFTRPGVLAAVERANATRTQTTDIIAKAVTSTRYDWTGVPALRRIMLGATEYLIANALLALPNDDWLKDPELADCSATLLMEGAAWALAPYLAERDWTSIPALRRFVLSEWERKNPLVAQLLASGTWLEDAEMATTVLDAAESDDKTRATAALFALQHTTWWKNARARKLVLARLDALDAYDARVLAQLLSAPGAWQDAELKPTLVRHALRMLKEGVYHASSLLEVIPECALLEEPELRRFVALELLVEDSCIDTLTRANAVVRMNWWVYPEWREPILELAPYQRWGERILESLPRFPFWTEPRARALVQNHVRSGNTTLRKLALAAWKVMPGKPLPHPRSYLAYLAMRGAPITLPED